MNLRISGRAVALYVFGVLCLAAAGWLYIAKQPTNPSMRYVVVALAMFSAFSVRTAVRAAKEHRLRR
jgi:hypothetical protein